MHTSRLRLLPCCLRVLVVGALAGGLSGYPFAQAGEWFSLGGASNESAADTPSDTLLEADLHSLRALGNQRSLVLRLSFRPGRQFNGQIYRSLQATLRLGCDGGQAFWKEVRFFSGEKAQGELLWAQLYESPSSPGLALGQTDWLPPTSEALLRKSACAEVNTLAP